MPIEREVLVARQEMLKNEIEVVKSKIDSLHKVLLTMDGARQDVEYWLAEEEKSSSASL